MKSVLSGRDIEELEFDELVKEVQIIASSADGCPGCYADPDPEWGRELRAVLKYIRQMPPMSDSEKNR